MSNLTSVVARRDAVLDLPEELDPELGDVVALQRVLVEPAGDLDVDHLQGASDGAGQDVRVPVQNIKHSFLHFLLKEFLLNIKIFIFYATLSNELVNLYLAGTERTVLYLRL